MISTVLLDNHQKYSKSLLVVFGAWSFFLLCRPQEYITFLQSLRPSLYLSLLLILLYFVNKPKIPSILVNKQVTQYKYLVLVIIVSIPFSYYRRLSFNEALLYCNIILFFAQFIINVNTISNLNNMLLVYCCGTSLYALFTLKAGIFVGDDRLSFGNTYDPNDIAYFLISFLTFNFLFLGKNNRFYIRIVSILGIIISLVAILKTGSRGGLVSLIAVILLLLIINTNTLKLSFFKKAIICLVALLSLNFVNVSTDRYETLLNPESDYNYSDETGRVAIWKTGIYLMAMHPLTGVGFRCFNEGIGRERAKRGLPPIWQAPHNSLIQIGAETGVIGLVIFILLSINAYKIFSKTVLKSQSEELVKVGEMARAGFVGHFTAAMFLSQAYSAYWAFYIALSAVLANMLSNENKSNGSDY